MSDETVPWEDFKSTLQAHVGSRRAQSIFCEETNTTASQMGKWRRTGSVPLWAHDAVMTIEVGRTDQQRFKGFHTNAFFDRVVVLSNENKTIAEMAEILTAEFSRKVTTGAVKSARYRVKERIAGYRSQGA